MISIEEARRLLAQCALHPRALLADLSQAAGHVLARDIAADRDIPPFDRAAVDGYAIRLTGPWREGSEFRVLGMVAAGQSWPGRLPPGSAVQIMTGAPVPRGADGVVMVERSERIAPDRVCLSGPFEARKRGSGSRTRPAPRPGIARRGEDAQKRSQVLSRGTRLEAAQMGVLASVGRTLVPVYRRPEVAVVITGSEVVGPGEVPGPAQIRDGNGLLLETLLDRSGAARVRSIGRAGDDPGSLRRAIRRSMKADVLVLSGGVSKGELDLVPDLLREAGYRVRFHRVAVRPGRPLLFGTIGGGGNRRAVFGLPGNPVSVLVTACEFLLPFLRRAAGWIDPGPAAISAVLAETIRRPPGLAHFVLGNLALDTDGRHRVRAIPTHGSGDYVSAGRANCLILLPAEDPVALAGREYLVHPLPGAP